MAWAADRQLAIAIRLAVAREIDPCALSSTGEAAAIQQQLVEDLRDLANRAESGQSYGETSAPGLSDCARIVLAVQPWVRLPKVRKRLRQLVAWFEQDRCAACEDSASRCGTEFQCSRGFGDLISNIDQDVTATIGRVRPGSPAPRRVFVVAWLKNKEPNGVLSIAGANAMTESGEVARESRVTLSIALRELDYRMLCQLPYILFHELVCHVYQDLVEQGADTPSVRANAANDCEWTAGFMDACAYSLAVSWLEADGRRASPWLPRHLSRPEIFHAPYHDWRYSRPGSTVSRRLASARETFFALARSFGSLHPTFDGVHPAVKFAVVMNGLVSARALRGRIVEELADAFDSAAGGEIAAALCQSFFTHGDPTRLCDELQTSLRQT